MLKTNLNVVVLIPIVLVIVLIPTGYSIKCWDCRSDLDPNCADPFDNSTLAVVDCNFIRELEDLPGVRPNICQKIKRKVHGEWITIRSCGFLKEPVGWDGEMCTQKTDINISTEYCSCNDKEACNASSQLKTSALLIWGIISSLCFRIFF